MYVKIEIKGFWDIIKIWSFVSMAISKIPEDWIMRELELDLCLKILNRQNNISPGYSYSKQRFWQKDISKLNKQIMRNKMTEKMTFNRLTLITFKLIQNEHQIHQYGLSRGLFNWTFSRFEPIWKPFNPWIAASAEAGLS